MARYFDINMDVVRETLERDLPGLQRSLTELHQQAMRGSRQQERRTVPALLRWAAVGAVVGGFEGRLVAPAPTPAPTPGCLGASKNRTLSVIPAKAGIQCLWSLLQNSR